MNQVRFRRCGVGLRSSGPGLRSFKVGLRDSGAGLRTARVGFRSFGAGLRGFQFLGARYAYFSGFASAKGSPLEVEISS